MAVLISESLLYLTWTWAFAVMYYILGKMNPQCILGPGGVNFEEGNFGFVDAFTLSWTTFSTVVRLKKGTRFAFAMQWRLVVFSADDLLAIGKQGYGSIHPAVHGEGSSTRCIIVTCLASWQAFVGMLWASFCSAIIFAKIAKYQSIAHVIFSTPVVIRFGEELMRNQDLDAETKHSLFKRDLSDDDGRSNKSGSGRSGMSRMGRAKVLDRRRGSSDVTMRYPCPILEFRVANLMHKESGGEIMNCKLNVVASTLEEVTKLDKHKASFFDGVLPSKQVVKGMKILQKAAKDAKKTAVSTSGELMSRGSFIQKINRSITEFASNKHTVMFDLSNSNSGGEGQPYKEGGGTESDNCSNVEDPFKDDASAELENLMQADKKEEDEFRKIARSQSIFVDEEPCEEGTRNNARRVFSKVEIETDSHPFFKRVWNIRHVLNQNSPCLTEEARNVIRLNGGLWPESLCNPDGIRGCLEISQLIVSLSGTAVVSGSSVYKLHVYEANSVEIGRTFENPLGRDPDGKLTVDMNLVHATIPQFEEEDETEALHNAWRFSFRGLGLSIHGGGL